MSMRRVIIAACVAACVLPAAAHASMTMLIGAAEDDVRSLDPAAARAKLDLAKAAGFNAIRITEVWTPGQSAVPQDGEAQVLQTTSATADLDGISLFATIMPFGSRTTPLTTAARREFAAFAADVVRQAPAIRSVIIGNEPNINRYWLPQFASDGSDAAASSYEGLLAQTYDAIKRVNKNEVVIGGSLSPHGQDSPTAIRQTHSPTAFLRDMGAAYRASGRTKPIMDGIATHPYGESSSTPPSLPHPRNTSIGLADYGKLVSLLGQAFNGTAQLGPTLPIYYDEYGIESRIPGAKLRFYHGREPSTTKPVPEAVQAEYYDEALTMAACQPTVRAMFLFHVADESNLDRWQSGLYYTDGSPKSSRASVRQTIQQIRAGAVDCSTTGHEHDGWVLVTGPKKAKPKSSHRLQGFWKSIAAH
jgi:hypothetical protein